jgi:hypothetical protein
MSSVQVVPRLVVIICDMFNLVVLHYIMIYIMVLIWKLANILTTVTVEVPHLRYW